MTSPQNLVDVSKLEAFNALVVTGAPHPARAHYFVCRVAVLEGAYERGYEEISKRERLAGQLEDGRWTWCETCLEAIRRQHETDVAGNIEMSLKRAAGLLDFIRGELAWTLSHSLHIRCPETGNLVPTGVLVSLVRWRRSEHSKQTHRLRCLECGDEHEWSGSDVVAGGALRRAATSYEEGQSFKRQRALRRSRKGAR